MSIKRWIDKNVVPVYNEILLSCEKEQSYAFAASWEDLEMIIWSEVSQKGKDKCCMGSSVGGI